MLEDISILAKLQDACINEVNEYRSELLRSLPHIVVVGSQSVGKTSLLENLIGIDDVFPKGNGAMITRCAMALQLNSAKGLEFEAELLLPSGELTTHHTPLSLRTALEKHMMGIENWVSDEVLRVKIRSSRTPDLCLMDLPGLIQLPSKDQPNNLDVRIKTLVKKYARSCSSTSGSIILAVTCATSDLANSEALRLARQLDPSGERTIGVLTKCDLVTDPGNITQLIDSTLRSKYPLKLGYVFVVNRIASGSQRRTMNRSQCYPPEPRSENSTEPRSQGTDAGDALSWFEQHDQYRPVLHVCGVESLEIILKRVLSIGIRRFSDERYAHFRDELAEIDLELLKLGPADHSVNATSVILSVVSKYCRAIDDLLEGKVNDNASYREFAQSTAYRLPNVADDKPAVDLVDDERQEPIDRTGVTTKSGKHELVGGARLNFVFHDWFCASIMKLDGLDGMDDFEIRTAIRNSSGTSPSLFIPESVFEMLVKKQIRRLENPVLQCVRQAVKELMKLFQHPIVTNSCVEFRKYPQLTSQIASVVKEVVSMRERKCVRQTQHLIHIQTAYINKAHPDFLVEKDKIQRIVLKAPAKVGSAVAGPPDDLSQSPAIAEPAWMAEPGPSTFMSFWRRHPITGSHMKPRSSNAASSNTPEVAAPPPAVAPVHAPGGGGTNPVVDQDTLLIEMVKMLIRSYFAIVKKSLADLVPKVIMYFLVNASREDVHEQLVVHLYKENTPESLLVESGEVSFLRKTLLEKQRMLKEACAILEGVETD